MRKTAGRALTEPPAPSEREQPVKSKTAAAIVPAKSRKAACGRMIRCSKPVRRRTNRPHAAFLPNTEKCKNQAMVGKANITPRRLLPRDRTRDAAGDRPCARAYAGRA